MFRLEATIIRQTFQYMDMTCSVPQDGIPYFFTLKSKAIPLQAWTGPEVSKSLRLPDFNTFST